MWNHGQSAGHDFNHVPECRRQCTEALVCDKMWVLIAVTVQVRHKCFFTTQEIRYLFFSFTSFLIYPLLFERGECLHHHFILFVIRWSHLIL